MSSVSSSSRKHRRIGSSNRATSSYTSNGARLLAEPPPSIFPSNLEDILRLLAVLAIAALVALACNSFFSRHRHQPAPTPFCDVASDGDDLDYCLPCPDHGECSGGELTGCAVGYKKIGRACVEDGEFNRTAKKFVDWVELHVCEARAQYLCKGVGNVQFWESDVLKLMEELVKRENVELDDVTLSMIKQVSLRDLEGLLDIRLDYDGVKKFMCPDHLVILYKSFICSLKYWIYEHLMLVSSILVSLAGGVILLWRFTKEKQLNARAEQLYQQVCEILEENSIMSEIGEPSNVKIQPWVVYSWLRDHLLLPKERKHPLLWKKVEELIQQDSRIDQYPKLIKGESRTVLEWQVKVSLSAKMRKREKQPTFSTKSANVDVDQPVDRDQHRAEVLLSS